MFEELSSKDPKVKYGAAKALLITAREHPDQLYPYADFFEKLMDSDNNILKWTAIDVVGRLAGVDRQRRVARNTDKLVSFLTAGKLITANHAISALASFARSYPDRREAITAELLKVEHCVYDTDECRNIALGNVIVELRSYFGSVQRKQPVIDFVRRQTSNSRNATARKAQAFLKRHAG